MSKQQIRGKSPIKQAEQTIRVEKAVALRAKGNTWAQIAEECGWNSAPVAAQAVGKELKLRAADAAGRVDEYRMAELAKLDEAEKIIWEIIGKKHVYINSGQVIKVEDENGDPIDLVDDAPTMAAIDRLLKIQERRSKYIGLDAPAQHRVSLGVVHTLNGVDLDDLS
jgi:hypothetical protein